MSCPERMAITRKLRIIPDARPTLGPALRDNPQPCNTRPSRKRMPSTMTSSDRAVVSAAMSKRSRVSGAISTALACTRMARSKSGWPPSPIPVAVFQRSRMTRSANQMIQSAESAVMTASAMRLWRMIGAKKTICGMFKWGSSKNQGGPAGFRIRSKGWRRL